MPVAAIIFEPLTGASPHTEGEGSGRLPPLRSVGSDQSNTGSASLPALRSIGTGSVTTRTLGSGSASLPPLRSLAAVGGLGYGSASLPPLRSQGSRNLLPVPQDGQGSASLPPLFSSGTVTRGDIGTGDAALPRLFAHGEEVAGGYGVARLPAPRSTGANAVPSYTAFINTTLDWPTAMVVATNDLILTERVVPADSAALQHVVPVSEGVMVDATPGSTLRALRALRDGPSMQAVAALVHQLVAVEGVLLDDVPDAVRRQIARVIDAVALSDTSQSRLAATRAVVAALTMDAMALRGWRFDEVAGTAFADAATQTLRRIEALAEAVVLDDEAAMNARFTVFVDEALVTADEASSKAAFFAALSEGAAFHAVLNLRGEQYVAWVLNAETGAGVSRYEGFGFNSFAGFEVGGVTRYFGAMDDGIHLLGGDSDNGAPIPAKVRSAMTNFGTARMKRMAMAYLGLTASGELLLKLIITSDKGVKEAFWYSLEGRNAQALREDRVKPDGGLESVYWQWELANVDGSDFDIDSMAFVPMATSRRV